MQSDPVPRQQCGLAEHVESREAKAHVFQTAPDHAAFWEFLFLLHLFV